MTTTSNYLPVVGEIVWVHWPMINNPRETKSRQALVAGYINNCVVLFSISVSSFTKGSRKFMDGYLAHDRFCVVSHECCKRDPAGKRKKAPQEVIDWCLRNLSFTVNSMRSVEECFKSLEEM